MIKFNRTGLNPLILSILLFGVINTSLANSRLSPIPLELIGDQPVVLQLTNTGNAALSYELTPFVWSQAQGQDRYAITESVVISPPQLTLQAGEQREIRIGYRQPNPQNTERSYRIMIEELPLVSEVENGTIEGMGGSIPLRFTHDLPLYVAPQADAQALTDWSAHWTEQGIRVTANNHGNLRQSAAGLALLGQHDSGDVQRWTPSVPLPNAVLPGASVEWLFQVTPSDAEAVHTWRLQAIARDGQVFELPLDLAHP